MVTEDGFAAIQVVLREREARDRQWWNDMRDCFAEESTVALTWYQGLGYGFVDGSEAMSVRAIRADTGSARPSCASQATEQ